MDKFYRYFLFRFSPGVSSIVFLCQLFSHWPCNVTLVFKSHPFFFLFLYLSIYLFIYLSIYLSCVCSVSLPLSAAARSTTETKWLDGGLEGWHRTARPAGGVVRGETAHWEGPRPPSATLPQQRQHGTTVSTEQKGASYFNVCWSFFVLLLPAIGYGDSRKYEGLVIEEIQEHIANGYQSLISEMRKRQNVKICHCLLLMGLCNSMFFYLVE